ncbi:APC family permease, partial [bacterium]|nr:APC family permease [bacterium]
MTSPQTPSPIPTLARHLGLWALVLYGVGDMLGSGIYALIGKAAGVMGNAVWLAFVVSMVAAVLTALSYASLGSRYPRAAGAAYVTQRAFSRPALSYFIGLMVMASGLTSMATQSRAFSDYFSVFVGDVPRAVLVVGFLLVLTAINFWGIRESAWLNAVCTTVEVSGLLIVVAVGWRFWGSANYLEPATLLGGGLANLTPMLVLQGAVLTFY